MARIQCASSIRILFGRLLSSLEQQAVYATLCFQIVGKSHLKFVCKTLCNNFPFSPKPGKATIGLEPRNVTALVGEATSLKCLAHGNPPPTITWARHGIGNGSELFFPSAKFSDSGWYRCVATNAYGVSFSPLAYLDVTGKVLDPSCGRIKIVRF